MIVGATVTVVLVIMIAIGTDDDVPLDPDGTGPTGARALVLLLESFAGGVDVVATPPTSDFDTAVLLNDRLTDSARIEIASWVRAGGTLVVADPASPFVPAFNDAEIGSFGPLTIEPGTCRVPALSAVGSLEVDGRVGYPVATGDRSCFGGDGSAFVVVSDVGAGTVVAVGGAGVWINSAIGRADNSVLAVALLAPEPGVEVAVLRSRLASTTVPSDGDPVPSDGRRDDVGGGSTGLLDLMPDYLKWVVVQLAVAWLVYAAARARRLGRPIVERQPVRIPGSEIVRATGRLFRRTSPSETAALLTESLRSEMASVLGLPRDSPARTVAEVAAARCALGADEIESVLIAPAVVDDAGLMELSTRIDRVREEVVSVRSRSSAR